MSNVCHATSPALGYGCCEAKNHTTDHIVRGWDGKIREQWPIVQVHRRTRLERLKSLTTGGSICIETIARIFDCPEASIRRDIYTLREAGYYIVLEGKQITNYGLRAALLAPQGDTHV